jgi:CHASE3 domain sensor protein
VIERIGSTLGAWLQPALRVWARIPVRTQGRITVALPLVAVFVSTCLAVVGNYQRHDIEADIQRKFEMSAALDELTASMVNAETGMRGYLLTGSDDFLEPYDRASAGLPTALTRLTDLASAEPGEKPRVDKLARVDRLRTLTGEQLTDLGWQRDHPTDPAIRGHLEYGKGLMDQIRAEVGAMQSEERSLLADRIADINAIRVRDYVSVVLALIVALLTRFVAWYLFKQGTLRRVERLTENVRSMRHGRPSPHPTTGKQDALGELEREIQLIET